MHFIRADFPIATSLNKAGEVGWTKDHKKEYEKKKSELKGQFSNISNRPLHGFISKKFFTNQ